MAQVFAAVDLGASGGRVVAGTLDAGRVTLEVVKRFPNEIVELDGHLRWDITGLYREVLSGLRRLGGPTSIGIDTWGVDYGLLDAAGKLIAEPIAYRDDRTVDVIDDVHRLVAPDELHHIDGLQYLPFNTIYQLVAEQRGPLWSDAAHVVLLPDLLAFWLTGKLRSELTNASTTGLLDVRARTWSDDLLDRLAIPRELLPPLQEPGEPRGATADGTPVVAVGSHDTASAVAAIPATTERFAYISSGTWSLVGLELDAPVLTSDAFEANFTNELGVDGRVRFLRNLSGLWLLQECLRAWEREDLDALLAEAGRLPAGAPVIDVEDPTFIPPGGMPQRITAAAGCALAPAGVVRCILDSLAVAYARTVHQAASLAAQDVDVVHIVGGGSQNRLLCQLTANACQLPVLAGPVEATALGNVMVQARAAGAVAGPLEALRAVAAASVPIERYLPA